MKYFIDLITLHLVEFSIYLGVFVAGTVGLFFLAKHKTQSGLALQALIIVRAYLYARFGAKAGSLVDIWIAGIKMIQDGEFSTDDGVDQFVRYVNLGASVKNLILSETELEAIKNLAASTLKMFLNKRKTEINLAVRQFSSMRFD
jgi:hypothetical protein